MDLFENKTVLITGAASGLGRSVAIEISKNKGNLVLVDLNYDGLEETKKLCQGSSSVKLINVDITDFDKLVSLLTNTCDCKEINSFVHCAGIPCIMPLKCIDYERYLKVMQVNTFSALEIAKWFSNKRNHSDVDPNIVLFRQFMDWSVRLEILHMLCRKVLFKV